MRAVAAANSSSTRAGIIATAPAPIIAAARPTCPAFSDISARASANSLPTSLASCAMASPKSSGIERSVGEGIAITPICCAMRCGRRCHRTASRFLRNSSKIARRRTRRARRSPGTPWAAVGRCRQGRPHYRARCPSGPAEPVESRNRSAPVDIISPALPSASVAASRAVATDAPNWSERSWPRRPSSSERSDATLEAL
jgi:hypothetical protein